MSRPLIADGSRVRLHDGAEGKMRREGAYWRFDMSDHELTGRSYFAADIVAAALRRGSIELLEEPTSDPATLRAP